MWDLCFHTFRCPKERGLSLSKSQVRGPEETSTWTPWTEGVKLFSYERRVENRERFPQVGMSSNLTFRVDPRKLLDTGDGLNQPSEGVQRILNPSSYRRKIETTPDRHVCSLNGYRLENRKSSEWFSRVHDSSQFRDGVPNLTSRRVTRTHSIFQRRVKWDLYVSKGGLSLTSNDGWRRKFYTIQRRSKRQLKDTRKLFSNIVLRDVWSKEKSSPTLCDCFEGVY